MGKEQTTSPVPPVSIQPPSYLFTDAFKFILEGRKITKIDWFNKEIYGCLKDGLLMLHKEDGKFYQWIISEGDMVGDDWIVLPEGN